MLNTIPSTEVLKQLFFNSLEDSLVLLNLIHEYNEEFSTEQRQQLKPMIASIMSELLSEERVITNV